MIASTLRSSEPVLLKNLWPTREFVRYGRKVIVIEITAGVAAALAKLKAKDFYLLEHDSSERSICHRLAIYLEQEFKGYDVDCEYNLDCENPTNRKLINVLEERVERVNENTRTSNVESYKDALSRGVSVFPDIVVHRRGTSADNLLVIEVKKSTNVKSRSYDFFKLHHYTDRSLGDLGYQYGVFVELKVGRQSNRTHQLVLFRDGKEARAGFATT